MTVKNPLLCHLAVFLALFLNMNAYADKYITPAKIVNNSSSPWIVRIALASGTLLTASDCQNNQECLIPAKSEQVVYYQSGSSINLTGAIYISDTTYDAVSNTTVKNKTHVYLINYTSAWYPNTPYIEHEGNTGAVALNNPQYGGITITAGSWCGNA